MIGYVRAYNRWKTSESGPFPIDLIHVSLTYGGYAIAASASSTAYCYIEILRLKKRINNEAKP